VPHAQDRPPDGMATQGNGGSVLTLKGRYRLIPDLRPRGRGGQGGRKRL
jgi:hypothetical protein